MKKSRQIVAVLCLFAAAALPCWAQRESPPGETPEASAAANAEFLKAADEVLAEMSGHMGLVQSRRMKDDVYAPHALPHEIGRAHV
jgi:hypothetical protein